MVAPPHEAPSPALRFHVALLVGVCRLLYATLRVVVTGEKEMELTRAEHGSVLLATWHGLSFVPIVRSRNKGYTGVVSLSRDGTFLATFFRSMGWKTIRGSTSRGGAGAARRCLQALAVPGTVLAVTPDGPRGPACKVQSGVVFLAQKSGKPIIPVGISSRFGWRLKSWDGFLIPAPFSLVSWVYAPPIFIGRDESLVDACLRVEQAICAANQQSARFITCNAN